jgi:hypothetical protein
MSMLTDNPTWAELLCLGDINTLTKLLNRLLENSRIAKGAKAARGRAKDPLAIAVADDLGKLYDEYCPSSRHRALRGESRSAVRIDFVHDTLKLFDLDLSKDTIRTYREKKNSLRSASNAPPVDELSQGAGPDFAGPPPGIAPGPTGPQGPSVDDEIAPLEADPGEGAP